mgnify:FL=1
MTVWLTEWQIENALNVNIFSIETQRMYNNLYFEYYKANKNHVDDQMSECVTDGQPRS